MPHAFRRTCLIGCLAPLLGSSALAQTAGGPSDMLALAVGDVLQIRLNNLDMAYEGLTGNAATQRLKKLSDPYGRVIRATGMKVD